MKKSFLFRRYIHAISLLVLFLGASSFVNMGTSARLIGDSNSGDSIEIVVYLDALTDDGYPMVLGVDGLVYYVDALGYLHQIAINTEQKCPYCGYKYSGRLEDHKASCSHCCKHCNEFYSDYSVHMLDCPFFNDKKNYCACGAVYDDTHVCPFAAKSDKISVVNNGGGLSVKNTYSIWDFNDFLDNKCGKIEMKTFVDNYGKHHSIIMTDCGNYEFIPQFGWCWHDGMFFLRSIPRKFFYSMFNNSNSQIRFRYGQNETIFDRGEQYIELLKASYENKKTAIVYDGSKKKVVDDFVERLRLNYYYVRVEFVQGEIAYYLYGNASPYILYGLPGDGYVPCPTRMYDNVRTVECVRHGDKFVKNSNYDVDKIDKVVKSLVDMSEQYYNKCIEDGDEEDGQYVISINDVLRRLIGYDFEDIIPDGTYSRNDLLQYPSELYIDYMEQHLDRFFVINMSNVQSAFDEAQMYANRGYVVFACRKDENDASLISVILPGQCNVETCGWDSSAPKAMVRTPNKCFASDFGLRAYSVPLSKIFSYDQFMGKNYRKDVKLIVVK